MVVTNFSEMAAEFLERVAKIVWCTVSTVDRKGRVRSRILHPIWEGNTGWIATGRRSHKAKGPIGPKPTRKDAEFAAGTAIITAAAEAAWNEATQTGGMGE